MASAAGFFWIVLALQIVFSAAVVALVARRWPARARAYRLVAPAALPVLLMAFVTVAYRHVQAQQGLPFRPLALGRFALAYFVLWLVGVLVAGVVLRRFRR